ncbi:MAG: HAMP domain-containing methyl-accepting chemotaxis protein [Beijerinckiaceae bacterium]|nr:HAMP domain-containing methyl-accepting chemotaxis protein [Beijerinckiaceae bacterium]
MGILSLGRVLMARQLILTCLILAFGLFAYEQSAAVVRLGESGADATTLVAAASRSAFWLLTLTASGVAFLVAFALPITYFTVTKPVREIADTVDRLIAGDLGGVVLGDRRRDEIGAIARGLIVLREAARAAPGALESEKATAREAQGRFLAGKIESFSEDLAISVGRLSTMAKRMTEASRGMIVAARNADEGSDQAKTVSVNAAVDVSSVASASEQLLVSIEEITQQVVQSTIAVRNSVERTVETNAGMNRLAAAAQKVGDVVSLISRIAAQTNLLALNATIEAARAGEAGRGFAVVAQEVKTLATQTAKATQDITGQIAEIQQATDTSVRAIESIQGKISEVEHISNLIAAAVREQGAATEAIARNVRSAASGSATISGHVEKVARSVGETSANASSVADLARELDEIAKVMTDKVMAFTHGLRAA